MFQVKICGVTRPEDAVAATEAGADAIGLNFYAKSKRFVELGPARSIAQAVAGGPMIVGVFVNAPADAIAEAFATVPLDAVQLHGDEPPDFALELPSGAPVVRAVRMTSAGLADLAAEQAELVRQARAYRAVLVDAAAEAGAYGGTGELADWELFRNERSRLSPTPVLLAGGLTAQNVAEAIAATECHGVDTASGVESSPGVKDPELVTEFVAAARRALSEHG